MIYDSDKTEGDINSSFERQLWDSQISHAETMNILADDSRYFLHQSMSTPCLDVLADSEGSYLVSLSGRKMLDFHGNNVHQLGYSNAYLIEKLLEQLKNLTFSPRRYTNIPSVELAKKLASLLPGDLNRCLFAPGGTSAISMALKLARIVTGKHKVVALWDSFHGASLDAIAAGGEAVSKKHMGPMMPGNIHIPPPTSYRGIFNNENNSQLAYADYLEYVIEKEGDIGAFLIETIRNTDVQIPTKEYMNRVREICTKHNVLLILDEIPIAPGRTGKMFAFEHYDIEPDIICLGKGLGGSLIPFAAIVARDNYNEASSVSLGHFTHEKNPLGSTIALAVLTYIEKENILKKVSDDELFIKSRLEKMKNKYPLIGDVRGIGLLWGIELVTDRVSRVKATTEAEKIMYECMRNGLSFKVSQGNVLQLSPPLTISRNELTEALTIVDKAISKFSA